MVGVDGIGGGYNPHQLADQSAVTTALAYWHMDTQRDAARAAERDRQVVHQDLADLSKGGSGAGGGHQIVLGRFDPQELSRRLSTAASVAGRRSVP